MMSLKRAVVTAAFVVAGLAVASAQNPNDWPGVGNDSGGSKYSLLTQISPANVSRLTTAWSYDLGGPGSYPTTPILAGNVLYLPQSSNIIALKADAGTELWKFEAVATTRSTPRPLSIRISRSSPGALERVAAMGNQAIRVRSTC